MEETSGVKEIEFGRGMTIYLGVFFTQLLVTKETDKTEKELRVLCFMWFQLSNNRKLSLNA